MSRNVALEMLGIVAAVIGVVAGVGCQIERKIREEVDVVREELNKTISHEAEMFRRDIERHEREITALRETRRASADASGIISPWNKVVGGLTPVEGVRI